MDLSSEHYSHYFMLFATGVFSFQYGAIHKGRPNPRGDGGYWLVKSGHMRTQGEGGRGRQKADILKFRFLPTLSKLK